MDKIYSIFDEKAQVFNTPFTEHNENTAIRSFTNLCLDGTGMVSKYPEDFKLYHIGDFDVVKGIITALPVPEFVVSAMQVISSRLVSREDDEAKGLAERLNM